MTLLSNIPKALDPTRKRFAPWTDPLARPLIRFENITKRFGDVTALADLSLDIYEREFFALLGPSGCGKTTLMRIVAGFEEANAGRVLLAGDDLAGVPPYRRPVNMMFQSYALFPHMHVWGNVAFGLKQERLSKTEIDTRVEEMLALVDLSGYEHRKPEQLSGGQRQRVALARALVKRPRVLLLDEPLASLDKKLREETQLELMHLQQKLGTTFIIVTHDQDEAMIMADRIAVMDRGRLAQVATPAEIYEQPNSRYVAAFVGDVNEIEAKVEEVGATESKLSGISVPTAIRVTQKIDAKPGAAVWLALRPEKIRISLSAPTDAEINCVEGTVNDIAYLGDFSVYHIALANGTLMKASRPNLTRLVERPIVWNDRVFLSWMPDAGVVLTR